MSTMEMLICFPDAMLETAAVKPFVLFRDHVRPTIEARRAALDAMYASVMGRPEIDPVLLLGITELQALERVPDRQALERCFFDLRWRLALGIPDKGKTGGKTGTGNLCQGKRGQAICVRLECLD